MLTDLKIENYRLFNQLHIRGLKRINLFAGSNNCGKTALLEALRILEAEEDLSVILFILKIRGEDIYALDPYVSMYNRRVLEAHKSDLPLEIKINNHVIFRQFTGNDYGYILKTKGGRKHSMLQLKMSINIPNPLIPRDKVVFLPFSRADHFPLQKLWDTIVLTPDEDIVLEILQKTILPDIVRLDVKPERTLVRLKLDKRPIPLQNLGDGAERVLLLAVSLVAARGKLLLLDEIEAGLHYSIIENLWEIIFRYAEKLDVQIFATTHSSDAIKGFTYMLERKDKSEMGAFFRMQRARDSGDIEVISYDAERLEFALDHNLETR